MADNKTSNEPKQQVHVATEPLTTGDGTWAYAPGDEVPAAVLDGDLAKANDWAAKTKRR